MTLEEIRLEVRHYLGEADDETDSLWSNTYLNKWINRFVREVAETTDALDAYATITTVDGTPNYDLPTMTGTPNKTIYEPTLVKRGNTSTLRPISVRNLSNINISLEGTPTQFLMFNDQIYLYPVPGMEETIHVWGYARPATMTADDDKCGLTEELTDIVIKLVLAKSRQLEEEFGVANQYYSEIPFNIADYITKNLRNQAQEAPTVKDTWGFTNSDYERWGG